MRVLVTGSSGQLGSALAEGLASEHEPIGLDCVAGDWTRHLVNVTDRDAIFHSMKGIEAVIHTASLHHPHIATHSRQAFIDVNITGTLNLLEAAIACDVKRFIYTSTTSLYGWSMVPVDEAVWVTEALAPCPRDIYDITKIAAEELCRTVAESSGMRMTCLRISRFFAQSPELLALYRLYRGVDLRDGVTAHLLALKSQKSSFEVYNISARSPFLQEDLSLLLQNAPQVLQHRVPQVVETFLRRGWHLPKQIDRVYVIEKAEQHLGYCPVYGFDEFIEELDRSE